LDNPRTTRKGTCGGDLQADARSENARVGCPSTAAYLATLPPDQQQALRQLRAQIVSVVPDAVETISYGMPAFKRDGQFLVSYAGWKRHCSIYPLTDTFLKAHADELKGYGRTKGSLHFTPETPLPDALVSDLIRARVDDLEAGGR
jgi:uncharacterized protein YdhG (YjbR/CyaY superfamily)